MAGCRQVEAPAARSSDNSLRIGFGLTTGANADAGIRQAAENITLEALVNLGEDGRPVSWLAESWEARDGVTWRLKLRPNVRFHDGTPLTASDVVDVLKEQLPRFMGPAFDDVDQIRPVLDDEIEITLKERSTFLLEALSLPIAKGAGRIGTGPFTLKDESNGTVTMQAFDAYHAGPPSVREVSIRPYSSVRSAWADLLRDEIDMLYEVGAETLDSLRDSSQVSIHVADRAYAHVVVFNLRRPPLQSASFRRGLNAAIDRSSIVMEALGGLGDEADGPVWPRHWAFDETWPKFTFKPVNLQTGSTRPQLKLIFAERADERIVLMLQRQLSSVGVDVVPEFAPIDETMGRVMSGDFDMFLADAGLGPTILRAGLFWRSGSPAYNVGRYSSAKVDTALDMIRSAVDDAAYKAGVAEFQKAIVDDPPAIFLAWSQRARAVSTRFDVPVEAGRDILSTLRLWRPMAGRKPAVN